ncbi:MAG: iron ABC transporter permease [Actinomycetota bacterium]|nr:iron ABC transporter permease [Actinomycetota bacterium]
MIRTEAPPQGRASRRHMSRASLITLGSAATAAIFAAPFGYLVIRNLGAPREFWSSITKADAVGALGRTLLLAVLVSAGACVVGSAAGWVAVRTDLPGRRLWRVVLPLPLVIPSFIAATAFIAAFAPGGLVATALAPAGVRTLPQVRGLVPAFVLLTLLTYPYVYLPVAARLAQIPPSLEEAGRTLGHRPASVARRIVLPEVRPAILAGTLLAFLYVISDFGAVQLLRYDTLTRSIYARRLFDQPTSLAQSLQLGILALLVVVLERTITRGPSVGKGRRDVRGLQHRLGAWKAPALACIVLLVGLALLAPIGVLSFWAVRGLLGGSARPGAIVTGLGQLVVPALNTGGISIITAVLTVLAVLPVAYLTVRHRKLIGSLANAIIVAGFALPGLSIALALVFWTLRSPSPLGALYQTLPLLLVGYMIHFGAHGLRAAQIAVASVPDQLEEAARVLQAGPWRRFTRLELPLMLPGLGAGAGLVLLSTMKELPATLLLAPAGFQTLATKIWTATEDAFLADASVAALLLVAVSGVLTWLLVVRRAEIPR